MTRHVSTESLARLAGGDLRGVMARRARAHLEGCQACQAVSAALTEIPVLLAGVPAPPMPAHLAARIDSALAAESAHRAAGHSPAPDHSLMPAGTRRGAGRPAHGRGPRRSALALPGTRILAAAAAIVIIGGGSYELVSHLQPGQSASPTYSAASGAAHQPPGNSYAGPRAPAAKGQLAYGPAVRYSYGGHTASVRPVQTGTDYQSSRLVSQVTQALAHLSSESTTLGPQVSPDTGVVFGGRSLADLSGCISRVAGGRMVLLVDLATFGGKPATVIVTGAHGHGQQAVVVGLGCSASAPDVLARQSMPGR